MIHYPPYAEYGKARRDAWFGWKMGMEDVVWCVFSLVFRIWPCWFRASKRTCHDRAEGSAIRPSDWKMRRPERPAASSLVPMLRLLSGHRLLAVGRSLSSRYGPWSRSEGGSERKARARRSRVAGDDLTVRMNMIPRQHAGMGWFHTGSLWGMLRIFRGRPRHSHNHGRRDPIPPEERSGQEIMVGGRGSLLSPWYN
jgi:hypothetical protein